MTQTERENQIIMDNHLSRAADIAVLLEEEFGFPFDKEKIRTRRKRLKRAIRETNMATRAQEDTMREDVTSDEGQRDESDESYQNYDDPHDLVTVPFGTGDCAWVLNDLHIPHHDPKALHIAKAIARDVKPNFGFLNGDGLDFAGLGRFPNHPKTPDVSREMAAARPILKDIRALILGRAEFKMGNHEYRYTRWLWSEGKKLGDLVRPLSDPYALDLGDWVVTHYHQDTDLGNFRVTHGEAVRSGAGNSARSEFEGRLISGISGHTHRAAPYRKTAAGREFVWFENGCLCRRDASYIGAKGADWQHAFAFLRHDGRNVQVEQVVINDYRAYYGGRLYTASS